MSTECHERYVISVLVSDRVGILRDITSALTDMDSNIDGISQTVVAGYFTVILTTSFYSPIVPADIRAKILQNFAQDEAAVVVCPYDHRTVVTPTVSGPRYVVTLSGSDRKGILKTVTRFLADKGVNIEDWYVEFENDKVIHIGEISVPSRLDIKHIQDEFRQVAAQLGLVAFMQHENIFRVTNEIGPVRNLIGSAPHA